MENKDKYDLLMEKYPILFCQRNKSQMETCMCWGICAGEGWYESLDELCNSLEELNCKFKIYGLRIQADQVKSKYAGLRFYYSIIMERNVFTKTLRFPFKFFADYIENHVDFQYKKVIDEPEQIKYFWHEITEKEYEEEINKSNLSYKLEEKNGKYYRKSELKCAAKSHKELMNHFFINKVFNFFRKIQFKIESIPFSQNKIDNANLLNKVVESLIEQAEQKCWNTCEWCGKYDAVGHEIVTTSGWITRICRECAKKHEDKKVKQFDESNNEIYNPRIVNYDTCYDFLDKFNKRKFIYNGVWFDSIWSAYYYNLFKKSNIPEVQNLSDYFSYIEKATPEYYYIIGEKQVRHYQVADDLDLMEEIIKSKYLNEYIKKDFMSTSGKSLIYFNKNCDNYWGSCLCDKCKNIIKNNNLGKIIEKVRDKVTNEGEFNNENGDIEK
jgi:predicted NAD-dependent protein-ADP-ribosyltransferase YbiA (DUF1768 family)